MEKYVPAGFVLAGLANGTGVVGASIVFADPHIATLDPAVMSNFGLAMIILWGLSDITTAGHWREMKWLVDICFVEEIVPSWSQDLRRQIMMQAKWIKPWNRKSWNS